ncbi:MAG: hypothetical protein ABDH32_00955 [Candidatus Caldarchaeales archaeon]
MREAVSGIEMIKLYFKILSLMIGVFALFSSQAVYPLDLISLEPDKIELFSGDEASVKINVGKEVQGLRVRIVIPEKPPWLNYTLSRVAGETPFTSILDIKTSPNAELGNHSIKIELWHGGQILEEEYLKIIIRSRPETPFLRFINYSCPAYVLIDEKFSLNLSFTYSSVDKIRTRVRIIVDGELETMIELELEGNGTIPLYRQVSPPSEPGEIEVISILEYLNLENNTWIMVEEKICKISVHPIPTTIKIRVNGLPVNLKIQVQVIILPSGDIIEKYIYGGIDYNLDIPLSQASTLLVAVQEEVQLSTNVKYVAENSIREIYLEPGWRIALQFFYSPWYLIVRDVEPDEIVLKILEGKEWVKAGSKVDVSPPRILQTSSQMYILSKIKIDGKDYDNIRLFRVNSTHSVSYVYERYYKIRLLFEPTISKDIFKREDIMEILPSQISEYVGEYWIKKDGVLRIPFKEIIAGQYRFKPSNIVSSLNIKMDRDLVYIFVDRPDTITLYYNIEAMIKIVVRDLDREDVEEEWVSLGGEYRVLLDRFLSPRSVGERIELISFKSSLNYKYLKDSREIILRVDSPGTIWLEVRRYFLVRVHTIVGLENIYPICNGPPGMVEWNYVDGIAESWVLRNTILTCYFPDKFKNDDGLVLFLKGFIGDLEFHNPGQISFYVERPLDISIHYSILRYHKLEGKTDIGLFIGEGEYPEGTTVFWRVEPQVSPADSFMELLGFRWRALNPFGIEEINGDRVIQILWVLTPIIDAPLIIFLQLTLITILSIIVWRLHKMWKFKMRLNLEGDGSIEE